MLGRLWLQAQTDCGQAGPGRRSACLVLLHALFVRSHKAASLCAAHTQSRCAHVCTVPVYMCSDSVRHETALRDLCMHSLQQQRVAPWCDAFVQQLTAVLQHILVQAAAAAAAPLAAV